jgi:hypothetical protein
MLLRVHVGTMLMTNERRAHDASHGMCASAQRTLERMPRAARDTLVEEGSGAPRVGIAA